MLQALVNVERGQLSDLITHVYPDIEGDLSRAAQAMLWSHLQKLVHDGLASRHRETHWIIGEEIWQITERGRQRSQSCD